MKHQLPRFSVPMPGAKVNWPFKKKEDVTCAHLSPGSKNGRRRFYANGQWMCAPCEHQYNRAR